MKPKCKTSRFPRFLVPLLVFSIPQWSGSQTPDSTPDGPIVELTPFSVTADDNVGYGASSSSSGRVKATYLEIAQSTSIVTADFLQDLKIYNTRDAVNFSPNVVGGGTHTSDYQIRGVKTQSTFADGFFVADNVNFDAFFADRIEIVKGPTSTNFGRGDPAGFVNVISKRPLFSNDTSFETMIGTGNEVRDNFRVTVDKNVVSGDRKTGLRFGALYHYGTDSTLDLSQMEKKGVFLSAQHKLNDKVILTFLGNYQKNEIPSAVGNTAFVDPFYLEENLTRVGKGDLDVPTRGRDYVFGYDGDHYDVDQLMLIGLAEIKLNNHWDARLGARFVDLEKVGFFGAGNPGSIAPNSEGVLTVAIPRLRDQVITDGMAYQFDLIGQYQSDFLNSEHSIMVGGDYGNETRSNNRQVQGLPRQPYLDFDRTTPEMNLPDINQSGFENSGVSWGTYVQLQSKFLDGKFGVTVSGRKQFYDISTRSRADGSSTTEKDNTDIVPRYSFSYYPTDTMSFYATRATHEDPATIVPEFLNYLPGDPREPLTITLLPKSVLNEFGFRAKLKDGKYIMSVARFEMNITGAQRLWFFLEEGGSGVPIEQRFPSDEKITGWEFELYGQPTPQTSFFIGGGIMDTSQSTGPGQPRIPIEKVQDNLSGYIKHHFSRDVSSGLGGIAGFKIVFDGFLIANQSPNTFYPKTRSVFDLGLYYRFNEDLTLDLKVNNVFDDVMTVHTHTYYPGRMAFLSFRGSF